MPATKGHTRRHAGVEVLELLVSGPPAFATDGGDTIVFWNHGAEALLGPPATEVLGRRCFDVMKGRDAFGNRFCHEDCAVVAMTRKGEPVHGFEMDIDPPSGHQQTLHVTILQIPGSRPDLFTLVHLLQPVDGSSRLARALERLGATAPSSGLVQLSAKPRPPETLPPLTVREKEVLQWMAGGLQNKEVAHRLRISPATVRNHVHNILEKLGVHSKIEAVSLAFRQGWVPAAPGPLDQTH